MFSVEKGFKKKLLYFINHPVRRIKTKRMCLVCHFLLLEIVVTVRAVSKTTILQYIEFLAKKKNNHLTDIQKKKQFMKITTLLFIYFSKQLLSFSMS